MDRLVLPLLLFVSICIFIDNASAENVWVPSGHGQERVNFVLVGATGNLAQKYLWQGLYDLYESSGSEIQFSYYGGARADESIGAEALKDILNSNVKYGDDDVKETFRRNIQYVKLKSCQDYEVFCRDVLNRKVDEPYCSKESCQDSEAVPEAGRVFYLAVPPYSYGELAECVHRVCRPPPNQSSTPWLRVVLEKPYGSDLDGVNALTTSLLKNFEEDEVYLIDHYLGKAAVKQILPFRSDNQDWLEPLLNNDYVERIEVVIKEQEDAEGRLNYYDSYGVFLDILQNHGMEMLTLVAMDLPVAPLNDSLAIREEKVKFLKSVAPIHPSHLLVGQYDGYVEHGKKEFKNDLFESNTATWGAVLLRVPTHRWKGVPIVLMSGKALDAKASYIRLVFKNTAFALEKNAQQRSKVMELVVNIGSKYEDVIGPSIAISVALLSRLPPSAIQSPWKGELSESAGHVVFRYQGDDKAYSVVVSDIVHGRRESFVGVNQLTSSWNMWTLAVEHLKSSAEPKLYGKGDIASLKFHWSPNGLQFLNEMDRRGYWPKDEASRPDYLPDRLYDGDLTIDVHVKPTMDLMEQIARDLQDIAVESVREHLAFHVAFPGGRSPKPLFHILSSMWRFPWSRTHVWFTDERCTTEPRYSNLWNAQDQLLRHVQVPPSNIHPMPVELARGPCHPEDEGTGLYQKWMEELLNDGALDVIVLGVGTDGHVASLFPDMVDDTGNAWVALTKAPRDMPVEQRMSLTMQAIGRAKYVFVVVTGKDKHGIAEILLGADSAGAGKALPVSLVLRRENARLYIDDLAKAG